MTADRAWGAAGAVASGVAALPRAAATIVRRLLRAGRVLQIEEVRAAVAEQLEVGALRGLHRRYLPSRIVVEVSAVDHRYLEPFLDRLTGAIRDEAQQRLAGGGWDAAAGPPAVRLDMNRHLRPGAVPRVRLEYPTPVASASWRPSGRRGPTAWGDRSREGATRGLFGLVITAAVDDGTAIQEAVRLHLAPSLPRAVLDPGAPPGSEVAWDGDARRFVESPGDEPVRPESGRLEVHPPPVVADSAAASLPAGWDRPWVELKRPGSDRLLWCPGGALIIGRADETAHLAPEHAGPSLSRCHLALTFSEAGGLGVVDLGSTNGTFVDGERLEPSAPRALALPATLTIGELGRLVVEMMNAE